jgi:hypothetical protein
MLMRRCIPSLLIATLAVGLAAATPSSARAADSPFVGNWILRVLLPGEEADVFLVEIKELDGKLEGRVLWAFPRFAADAKVDKVIADGDKILHLTVSGGGQTFPASLYVPKGDGKPDKLVGSVQYFGPQFAHLSRTELKKLDPTKAASDVPSRKDFDAATQMPDFKEKKAALKDLLGKKDVAPQIALLAGLELLGTMADSDADKDAVAKQAEETIKFAETYGRNMRLHAMQQAAKRLAANEKMAATAVELAQRAEKALDKDTPTEMQLAVLSTLKTAFLKAGKATEAKELAPKIETLNEQLDQEFLKDAVPFKTEGIARKEKGERVVLFELFTGAQCPPCVAADVAFDGLLKSYKPADVAFLQYHLHIPRPDALTNEDSLKRMEFYGLDSTPAIYIDGDPGPQSGGSKANAKERYDELVKAIDSALSIDSQAKIQLSAEKKDGKINVHAQVSGVTKTGDNVRLHLVLVEEVARYLGSNRQRLHHHVVRGFPGGVDGIALKEKNSSHNVIINVDDVRKSLNDYLAGFKEGNFAEDERPLDLKKLRLVAFIQRTGSNKEVYQATQIDLPELK